MSRAPLPPELERFLTKPRPAVVSTLRPDGSPVTTVTWYEWLAGRVLLTMDADGRRIRNIRRDPRVALTVLGPGSSRARPKAGGSITVSERSASDSGACAPKAMSPPGTLR